MASATGAAPGFRATACSTVLAGALALLAAGCAGSTQAGEDQQPSSASSSPAQAGAGAAPSGSSSRPGEAEADQEPVQDPGSFDLGRQDLAGLLIHQIEVEIIVGHASGKAFHPRDLRSDFGQLLAQGLVFSDDLRTTEQTKVPLYGGEGEIKAQRERDRKEQPRAKCGSLGSCHGSASSRLLLDVAGL